MRGPKTSIGLPREEAQMLRYKLPEHKVLYIAHNDPKQIVLLYRDASTDPSLPRGCWTPPDVIEYYHIDWNNPNSNGPFITEVKGGTILAVDLFFLKFFRKIKKPSPRQEMMIKNYGFWKMLKKFDKERIDAGFYVVDKNS